MTKKYTAIIYSAQGSYLASESILQELSTYPHEDKNFLPIIKANLGSVSLKLGKIDASIKYANECIEFSKGDDPSMANCQLLLAESYFALGKIKESLKHLTASNEISSSKDNESMRSDSLHLSSLILARKGQTQDAMNASITFRENELFKLSFLDGLTSLYNRRSFDAYLEKL